MTRWEQIKAVQRMQDYVDAHLAEPVTLQALARAARYSPWYAARLFREIVGMAPFEYVRARRLTAAADRLRDGGLRVVDVAFDFEFGSHEGFSRAFARQFGVPPSRYHKAVGSADAGGEAGRTFLPAPARSFYRSLQQGTLGQGGAAVKTEGTAHTVFVQVVERPARRLVLRRGREATHYFEYCDEVGCDVWSRLGEVRPALHEPMGLWLPDALRTPGTSLYAMGVEVPADFAGEVLDGCEVIDLPPCRLMVFQGPKFEDADFEQAVADLWAAMSAYDPRPYGFEWADDDAPRFQLEPRGDRGCVEGRPVRPVGG